VSINASEFEPARRRRATYPGTDLRHLVVDGKKELVGPDTRGNYWTACHVDYDETTNTSVVIRRPVSRHELESHPQVLEHLTRIEQNLHARLSE
jgi:hypothetical protein